MVLARRLLVLVLVVGVLVGGWRFAASNADLVRVDLLFVEFSEVAMWLVLAVAFASGALVAGVLYALELARAGMVGRRYRKTVAGLEAEVHQLRNLPLAPDESPRSEALGAARAEESLGASSLGSGPSA